MGKASPLLHLPVFEIIFIADGLVVEQFCYKLGIILSNLVPLCSPEQQKMVFPLATVMVLLMYTCVVLVCADRTDRAGCVQGVFTTVCTVSQWE